MTFPFPISILSTLLLITWDVTTANNAAHSRVESTRFNKIIRTHSGPVFGTDILYNGRWVKQYLGIPFAKPPVGELRFQKTQPVEPWNDTLLANQMPPACIQYIEETDPTYPWYDSEEGKSEDCLYLNIWVPTDSAGNLGTKRLPTIFWIYGGGFTLGSIRQDIYNGYVLAAEGDVIVVTINYRMGAFGFFTSGTEDAPGNVGIYDMLEALKWVNWNIPVFGGNPSKITLAGQSSGSMAVGLLCVSPLAKGLFHSVIMESGSPAYLFAEDNTTNWKLSQHLAKQLGCTSGALNINIFPDHSLQCLRNKDAMEIAKALNSFHPTSPRHFFPSYGDEILPINARLALIHGNINHVPVLIGNTKNEGSMQIVTTYPEVFGFRGEFYPQINKSFAESIIRNIFQNFYDPEEINKHYLGDVGELDYQKVHEQLFAASGDYSILCPTVYFAESYANAGNDVYYYYFVHRPKRSNWTNWLGVVHYDEVQFVFGLPMRRPKFYEHQEILLSKKIIHIWSEFAEFGSLDWDTYSRQRPYYTELHADLWPTYGLGPHGGNCDFFRKYFDFDQMPTNYWK